MTPYIHNIVYFTTNRSKQNLCLSEHVKLCLGNDQLPYILHVYIEQLQNALYGNNEIGSLVVQKAAFVLYIISIDCDF